MQKGLRALAKRCKNIRYTNGLLLGFLIMGMLSFSDAGSKGLNTTEIKSIENSINQTKKEMGTSISELKKLFKDAKKENNKLMKNSNLELIQLIEQGDQAIKSPWSSWQYGTDYVYDSQTSLYKGFGDRQQKYPFQGIYRRNSWMERNTLATSKRSLSDIVSSGIREEGVFYSTDKNLNYGFLPLKDIAEPEVEIQVLANVNPKSVNKQEININQQIDTPRTIARPEVRISVNSPLEAPSIEFPQVTPVNINVQNPANPDTPTLATAPAINITLTKPTVTLNITPPTLNMTVSAPNSPNIDIDIDAPGVPTVNALNVTAPAQVTAPNISFTAVNPVDFILSPHDISSSSRKMMLNGSSYAYNGQTIEVNIKPNENNKNSSADYIGTWGRIKGQDNINTIVNVNAENTRAFMVDEGIDYRDATIKPFKYAGTINLNNSKNVGIDVQGTHTPYSGQSLNPGFNSMTKVANIKVINAGKINGNGGGTGANTIKNQVAFGFNNFDTSSNNTRNEMINEGEIT